MAKINELRFVFEAQTKPGYDGQMNDVFSNADTEAQKIGIRVIRENFPGFGIIGEEQQEFSRLLCSIPGVNWYFTLDLLDGTKAYVRKQSHGIGSMISLVMDGKVVAAFVGDVISGEIYGYRPESERVHRIPAVHPSMPLSINEDLTLAEQYVMLRNDAYRHSEFMQVLIGDPAKGGIFKGGESTSGSIGLSMARLWKGEMGAAVLMPGFNTPWDICPVIGISQRMGFVFLRTVQTDAGMRLEPYEPAVAMDTVYAEHEALVVHRSRLGELSHVMRK
jgi:fructose-1,6-bisphosphatase/inositol monophosphatase family enzyme